MSEDLVSLWGDAVKRTAGFVARDFPDVEREDVMQELFLFIMKHPTLESPDKPGSTMVLMKAARFYAWNQRKQHLQLSPQYSYRTSDIKAILETVFDQRDWANVRVPEDAQSEYNDVFLEINSDVKRAWESLGHAQKKVIFEKYALGIDPQGQTEAKRLSRAIEKLTDAINWYQKPDNRDYVGTRRVITNANARYIIQDD
jgi:hypothetical protein